MTQRLIWGATLLTLPLTGCGMVVDGANKLGSYMPTIGERCEYWQCITASGQAQSDAIKQNQDDKEKEAMIRHDWVEDPPDFPTSPSAKAAPVAKPASAQQQAQPQQPAQPTPYDQYQSR